MIWLMGTPLKAIRNKIVSLQEAARIAARMRTRGKTIVTTNGTFDLLHAGHVDSVARAKNLGDVLFVGINSDTSVRRYKGPTRPIVPARERAFMLAALSCVDYVFIFSTDTPVPWIRKIRPHVHAKGSDRTMREVVEKEAVELVGGHVVLLPHTKRHSTTRLIARARA